MVIFILKKYFYSYILLLMSRTKRAVLLNFIHISRGGQTFFVKKTNLKSPASSVLALLMLMTLTPISFL